MDRKSAIDQYRPDLKSFEQVYRDIHKNPKLSKQEVRTASIAASHLEALGDLIVHQRIGGYGVVGVLRNGPGPTVLLRADMDALPHLEKTHLDYASTKVVTDLEGKSTPVIGDITPPSQVVVEWDSDLNPCKEESLARQPRAEF
ncbi:MAG: hypothetical protein M1830_010537, partial [Pleopsidium flavum]